MLAMELWKEYKYKLADERPKAYGKYQDILGHLESILKNSDVIDPKFRSLMIKTELELFSEKCKKNLGFV